MMLAHWRGFRRGSSGEIRRSGGCTGSPAQRHDKLVVVLHKKAGRESGQRENFVPARKMDVLPTLFYKPRSA